MDSLFKAGAIAEEIGELAEEIGRPVRIMEVCGTHTVALRQSGVLSLLPDSVFLVSGPGCPVCVTPASYIENALRLIDTEDVVIASFGDMMKVPSADGRSLSAYLGTEKVKMVYSPWEVVGTAEQTTREVLFLGIGFETTIPAIATVFLHVHEKNIHNCSLYSAFKLVPPALHALLNDPETSLDGFLLPGHVSAVIGRSAYQFLCDRYGVPGVITGFEGRDMLLGVKKLLQIISKDDCGIVNEYTRVVRDEGNGRAREVMNTLLTPADACWRGLGVIPKSGMDVRNEYADIDGITRFGLAPLHNTDPGGCLCGTIIQGKALPADCPLFGTSCTPDRPSGPCMVSSEGACAAFYQYGDTL